MPDSPDNILSILVKLGVVGQSDIVAARQLLDDTGKSATAAGDALGDSAAGTEKAAGAVAEHVEKLKGQEQLLGVLKQIAPELGESIEAAFSGPLAPVILLGMTIRDLQGQMRNHGVEFSKTVNGLQPSELEAHEEQVQALAKSWDDATAALAQYHVGLPKDPIRRQPDDINAPADTRMDSARNNDEISGNVAAVYDRRTPEFIGDSTAVTDRRYTKQDKDQDNVIVDALNLHGGKTNQALGDVAAAIGLTEQQKFNIVTRILNYQMTVQQAWAGLDARLTAMEAGHAQTAYNTQ